MLDIVINTKSLDTCFLTLCFFNILIIVVNKFKIRRNNVQNINYTNNEKSWVNYIQFFWAITISLAIFIIISKLSHNFFISLIIVVFLIRLFIRTVRTDVFYSNLENKYSCVVCSLILINFFTYNNYDIYLHSFQNVSHSWKEVLLITFIVLKIISYVYFIILNISIFFSFFKFSKLLTRLSMLISKLLNLTRKIVSSLSDFQKKISSDIFSLKSAIIYFLFYPIFIIITVIINLLLMIVIYLTKGIVSLFNICDKYTKQSKFFVWIIVKISLIFSLVFTYFVIISSPLFSEKVINAYNYLSTVILIPILLDSLHEINKKKIRK